MINQSQSWGKNWAYRSRVTLYDIAW